MANTNPCSECNLYFALVKPHRDGKGSTDTKKGHCLDKTVYAKNKPGKPVYPPHAKVADLPFNRHTIVLRRADDVVKSCAAFVLKKG